MQAAVLAGNVLGQVSQGAQSTTVSIPVLVDVASRNTRDTEIATDTSLMPMLRTVGEVGNKSVSPEGLIVAGSKWTFGHNSRVTGGIGISSRPGGAANIRVENETRSVTDVLMTMLSETRIIPPLRV